MEIKPFIDLINTQSTKIKHKKETPIVKNNTVSPKSDKKGSDKKHNVKIPPLVLAAIMGVSVPVGYNLLREKDPRIIQTSPVELAQRPASLNDIPIRPLTADESYAITEERGFLNYDEFNTNDPESLIQQYLNIVERNIDADYLLALETIENVNFSSLDNNVGGNIVCGTKEININAPEYLNLDDTDSISTRQNANNFYHLRKILTLGHESGHALQCSEDRSFNGLTVGNISIYDEVEADIVKLRLYQRLKAQYHNVFDEESEIQLNIYNKNGITGLTEYVTNLREFSEGIISKDDFIEYYMNQKADLTADYVNLISRYSPEIASDLAITQLNINDLSWRTRDGQSRIPLVDRETSIDDAGNYIIDIHHEALEKTDVRVAYEIINQMAYQRLYAENQSQSTSLNPSLSNIQNLRVTAEEEALNFYENWKADTGQTDPDLEYMLNLKNENPEQFANYVKEIYFGV